MNQIKNNKKYSIIGLIEKLNRTLLLKKIAKMNYKKINNYSHFLPNTASNIIFNARNLSLSSFIFLKYGKDVAEQGSV
jgi:hypothetical protein